MTKLEEELLRAINTGLDGVEEGEYDGEKAMQACAEVAKKYIMDYNTFIQANISTIVPSLRDHGAHAAFCDKLNDLRNKFLDIDSGN